MDHNLGIEKKKRKEIEKKGSVELKYWLNCKINSKITNNKPIPEIFPISTY